MVNKIERNYSIDTLRTISTMLVVLLHISTYYVLNAMDTKIYGFNFIVGNIVDSFTRIAVPLFVLISGRFLLGRNETFIEFYKKRAKRVLIPLFIWTLFYLTVRFIEGEPLKNLVIGTLLGHPYYHMWYLYMLTGLYMIAPILNMLIQRLNKKHLFYFALFLLLFGLINFLFDTLRGNNSLFILWFLNYLGYFLFGYLSQDTKKVNLFILFGIYAVSGLLITILSNYTITQNKSIYFYEYLSPFVIIGSITIYKLFNQISINENIFSKISGYTFGIFLIHPFFLHVLLLFLQNHNIIENALIGIPIMFSLVFLTSLLFIYLFSKSKLLRRII